VSRADAMRLVRRAGERTGDRVTRATTLVVVGSRPGATLQRARQLDVPVMTEREFVSRYGNQRYRPSRTGPGIAT